MSNFITLIGIGIIAVILLFMFFKLGENKSKDHYVLQIVCLGFVLVLLFLAGKTMLDEKDYCAWLVTNSTSVGATTNYNYDYFCEENSHNTSGLVFKAINWLIILVTAYVVLYTVWQIFTYLSFKKQKKGSQK